MGESHSMQSEVWISNSSPSDISWIWRLHEAVFTHYHYKQKNFKKISGMGEEEIKSHSFSKLKIEIPC